MKLPKILSIIFLSAYGCSTDTTIEFCPLWMGAATPIETPLTSKRNSNSSNSSYSLYFNPQLLPFSIKWNKEKGFYIEHYNNIEIATPIGSFGLEYTFSSKGTINGIEIKESDFIVVIVDKKEGKQDVFKIEGYNRLKVVLAGKTEIDAQPGIVQIDATFAKVNEITFKDYSKAILFNSTLKEIPFEIQVGNNFGKSTNIFKCTLPSKMYRAIPMDELNGLIDANVFIKVHNDLPNNDTYHEVKKKLGYGDLCEIYNENGGNIGLKKINLTNSIGWQRMKPSTQNAQSGIPDDKTIFRQSTIIGEEEAIKSRTPSLPPQNRPISPQQNQSTPNEYGVEEITILTIDDSETYQPRSLPSIEDKETKPEKIKTHSCLLKMKRGMDKEKPIKGNVITFNFEVELEDIISNHAPHSYEIKKVKSCTKLIILNPLNFWSNSKKLIVNSKKSWYDFADSDVKL